jgi:D-threo-aldose 1-dehydrogenase
MIEQRIIANTEISVSSLGFGTASLHHIFFQRNRLRLLEHIYENGVTHFDTSPFYGYGLSELDLGKFQNSKKSQITICTKIGLYPSVTYSSNSLSVWNQKALGKIFQNYSKPLIDFSVKSAKKSIIASLRRLKRDYIDFLFLHEPLIDILNTDELQKFLENELAEGRIRAFGIAGERIKIEDFLKINHKLSRVVQTRDSLLEKESNFLLELNHPIQFTYGYFSRRNYNELKITPKDLIKQALGRNTTGCVLFSTSTKEHFNEIIEVVR